MHFTLEVDDADVQRLLAAHQRLADHELVRERVALNVEPAVQRPGQGDVWNGLVLALATSQQRSAPGSRVWDLWCARPCPLRLEVIRSWQPDISQRAGNFLQDWGGIRYHHRIGEFLEHNYRLLFEDGGDEMLDRVVEELWRLRQLPLTWSEDARHREREVCVEVLGLDLKGIGTKQCRNWLMNAHLLRYEIPLDSRVLKFLRPMFPDDFPLAQGLLSWPSYYHFIEDVVQELCKRASILPCVADAVMFLVADGRA